MAHIDELVRKVADPQLRDALAEQVRTLTDRTEFGLTFQRHLPESVRIPEQRIRRGNLVELRDEAKGGPRYRVVSAKSEESAVAVIELDAAGEPAGEVTGKLRKDLVVVKQFGEPIYPGLRQTGEAGTSAAGQPSHVVIAGENFHALQALEYTHEARVDLIYIDPPYNTGAADWKYNDRYVDGADSYRHSKWLSFIERRLKIAKRLLKDTGVVVLAIDDNEHHRLRMLADQVFGEENFLANIVWQGGVKNDSRFGGGGLDYQVIYARSRSSLVALDTRWKDLKPGFDKVMAAAADAWANSGHDAEVATDLIRRWWKDNGEGFDPGMKLNNRIDESGRLFQADNLAAPNSRDYYRPLIHPVTGLPCPVPPKGWRAMDSTMDQWLAEGRIAFGKDHTTTPRYKRYLDEVATRVPENSFKSERTAGSKHLAGILGDHRFPFPKDHRVLMRWFRMIAPPDGVILDFFAGSGTTAEAVIRLNEEDGGTRQCILVTNNELSKSEDAKLRKQGHRPGDAEYEAFGVFRHVTKPRVSTVLTGLREDGSRFGEGIEGQNAAFFDLTYEDENLVALGRRFEAIAPLLWLRAGATGTLIEKIDPTGFSAPADANYAVIFDTDEAARASEAIHDGVQMVFIVTDSDADFRSTVMALPRRLQPTAQRLYSTYLRSFQINHG